MIEDLKPCPFCGGSASIERYGDPRQSTIYQCDHCSCRLETGEEWDHGKVWNNRTDPECAATKDAARYRYLRDHCSSHYPMTYEQPAEWSIGWEFQQSTPLEAYGSFDKWIDADIEANRKRQAEIDAEDAS